MPSWTGCQFLMRFEVIKIKIKKDDIPCFCLGKIGAQGTKTRINVEVHQMWIINTDLGEKGETGTKSVLSQYTILL